MKPIQFADLGKLLLCALFLNLAACGGGDDASPGGSTSSPSAFPTGPDANEAGTGNNNIANATSHAIGDNTVNTIWPQGDVDYYAVTLTAGTEYEFSANRICATCDVYLYLYNSSGTQLASDDDYIGFDSQLRYTPTVTDTYYLMVRAFDSIYGVAQYTFGARVFTDGDGDTFSSYYDCNDGDPTIYLHALEVVSDGIDQNCSGVDRLQGTTADSAEADNTPATARPMTPLQGYAREIQYRDEIYMDNSRTLHDATDEDWFTITVPGNSAMSIGAVQQSGVATSQVFESDATTPVPGLTLMNTTSNPMTFYARIFGSNAAGAWYVLYTMDLGQDEDGDGFYSRNWGFSRDCNDGDSTIFPGAFETAGDGIDQNCDGSDNTLIPFSAVTPKETGNLF